MPHPSLTDTQCKVALIMSFNLAMFIGEEDALFGTIAGFMTGFGWIGFAIAIISLFENRPIKYVLINGGSLVVLITLLEAIPGAWK